MLKAALDTSSSQAAFVVTDASGNCLIQLTDVPLGRESGALPGRVMSTLEAHSIDLHTIQQWSIGMGPGSFTGIRVGAALVKGLCAGSGASYRGIPSSLAMVLATVKDTDETAVALHDGRRSEILVSPYKRVDERWVPDGEPYPQAISEFSTDPYDCIAILATDRALSDVQERHEGLTVLEAFPAESLIKAIPEYNPTSFADQESGTEPIYVRPAVFVEPSLKKPK